MGGVDGYDWSIFGGNPTPGDPDGTRAMAARLRDLADGVDQHNRLLRSVGADSASVWSGPAADAFRPHLDKLPGQLHKLTTSYHDAADALNGYWPRLAAAQAQAVDAWHKAQTAHAQVQTAHAQVAQADQAATSAADTYNQAATAATAAPPDPTGATAAHLSSLQTAYQSAANQLSGAHAALAGANANLQAAHAQADSARSQAKAAARHAAAGLHSASNAGIHNPHHSLIGSIVDHVEGIAKDAFHFAEHHWEAFLPGGDLLLAGEWLVKQDPALFRKASAILGTVTLAAGVLSMVPVIGEIALPVAAVSAGLQTADDFFLARDGEGSWRAVGWDALGDASFGAGDGLARLGQGLGESGELATRAGELTSKMGNLEGEVSSLTREAAGLRSFDSYTVPLLDPGGGPSQLVKVSDLAGETEGRLGSTTRELDMTQRQLANNKAAIRQQPNLSGAGARFRFSLPTGEEGALAKTGRFFQNPADYVKGALNTKGESLVGKMSDQFGTAWSAPGRVFTAGGYGVGAVSSWWGGVQDAGAYHEAWKPAPAH